MASHSLNGSRCTGQSDLLVSLYILHAHIHCHCDIAALQAGSSSLKERSLSCSAQKLLRSATGQVSELVFVFALNKVSIALCRVVQLRCPTSLGNCIDPYLATLKPTSLQNSVAALTTAEGLTNAEPHMSGAQSLITGSQNALF